MKKFFSYYSFYAVKMFLNQFAVSLFGMTLSMVFTNIDSVAGQLISSIASVIFYLFLIYNMTWDLGYHDRIEELHGNIKPHPINGLLTSLLANSINLIMAILVALGIGFGSFAIIIEGMYAGIMIITAGEGAIPIWIYFAIIIPAPIVASISYFLGLKDKRLFPNFNIKHKEKK